MVGPKQGVIIFVKMYIRDDTIIHSELHLDNCGHEGLYRNFYTTPN